jgi:hypothetical protein
MDPGPIRTVGPIEESDHEKIRLSRTPGAALRRPWSPDGGRSRGGFTSI